MKSFLLGFFLVILPSIEALADPACDANSTKSALVIIDMQSYFRTRTGYHQTSENIKKYDAVVNEQLAAIHAAKAANIPIILVKYDIERQVDHTSTEKDGTVFAISNASAVQPKLLDETSGYAKLHVVKKNSDSIFFEKNAYLDETKEILKKYNIGKLIITGANGGACVKSSIEGAMYNNCKVVALSPAIADFNYKEFIYPYKGYYEDIKKIDCKKCSFEEVSTLEHAKEHMNTKPRAPQKSTSSEGIR